MQKNSLYIIEKKQNNDHVCKKSTIITLSKLSSIPTHDQHRYKKKHFDICQEYADNISAITTDKIKRGHTKKSIWSESEI